MSPGATSTLESAASIIMSLPVDSRDRAA
jgi:hypothetical protein